MADETHSLKHHQVNKKTDILPDYSFPEPVSKSITDIQTAFLSENQCIKLFVSGMQEQIDFRVTPVVKLGRFDTHVGDGNDYTLDLTAYGALERGVSRRHCQLTLVNNQLVITDLDSTNGTFINGKRLEPHHPHVLKKGEPIALGRLVIRVVFES